MSKTTYDTRITKTRAIPSPRLVIESLPLTASAASLVEHSRTAISNILHGKDKRLLAIVGPCSVHDPKSAIQYAEQLVQLRETLKETMEIVMRVYFEKPRTTVGWKGLINDPDLDNRFNINKGLHVARKLMLDINQIGLPVGTEFLDIVTGQYYSDLVSWGAIGARTTESQVHRELASGLSCPIGFKNGTSGDIQVAVDAVCSSQHPHIFLSPTLEGTISIFETKGNQDAHIILRGGQNPNYDAGSIEKTVALKERSQVGTGIIIDFSHANSAKQFKKQLEVGNNVAQQIANGNQTISGIMIESHLIEGRQSIAPNKALVFGQSITDGCLGWADTERLLLKLADSVSHSK